MQVTIHAKVPPEVAQAAMKHANVLMDAVGYEHHGAHSVRVLEPAQWETTTIPAFLLAPGSWLAGQLCQRIGFSREDWPEMGYQEQLLLLPNGEVIGCE